MPGLEVQRAKSRVQIAGRSRPQTVRIKVRMLLIGVLIVLGTLAWGIGWMAHSLFDRQTSPPPTRPAERTEGRPTATHSPTATPDLSPGVAFTSSPNGVAFTPGATDAPTLLPATSTPAPTAETQIQTLTVEADDRGVYDVIRRACGLPRDYFLYPGDEITQQTWLLNEFAEESPSIEVGQAIQVPIHLCP